MKRNINLLPPAEQKKNDLSFSTNQFLRFAIWLVLSLITVAVILFSVQIFRQLELNRVNRSVAQRKSELAEIEQQFLKDDVKEINTALTNFNRVLGVHLDYTPILTEFARLIPADVTLDRITIDRESRLVRVSGHALSRNSVLVLRRRLIEADMFENVNLPLKNIERPNNLEWSYQFTVKEN